MNRINITIEGINLGEIREDHIKDAYKKYGATTPEQVAEIYIDKILTNVDKMTRAEKVKKIIEMANYYKYDSVASMLVGEMIPDLRPDDEVCHRCKYYSKGFCAYDLCNTNPFEKGCKAWDEKYDKEKVTHIATGYIKYGKE